ncbi:amidohydrolase family protein [Paraburkholderia sp. J67]|uniref:amidohydrolase family protein n=1 Tax=Paraburkholderia sp. J67 TaxID=2805435 RepID=UPI002ABE1EDA|nr:amidohydrolase family protein [Paraburkholderia sp. J67]
MQIVDAQVHAWENGSSTGHHRRAPVTRDVLVDEMARAGVDRVLLVPPLWDPESNAYSLALARNEPDRFAVMGLLPADCENPAAALARWNETPGMRGVRFLFNTPDRIAPLLAGRYEDVWPLAQENGLVIALHVPGALGEAEKIVRRYPKLRLIVDHLGVPRGASGPTAFDHLPALLALARYPNVHVKAAGVGDYALDPWPFRSIEPTLRQIFDAFGPQRIVWASDLSRLHHPYRQCVTHFSEALSWLSDAERADVMGGNLCRLLDWPAGAARGTTLAA